MPETALHIFVGICPAKFTFSERWEQGNSIVHPFYKLSFGVYIFQLPAFSFRILCGKTGNLL